MDSSGLALNTFVGYVVSILANISTAGLADATRRRQDAELQRTMAHLGAIRDAETLSQELGHAFESVRKICQTVGASAGEAPLLGLLSDPVYQTDLAAWITTRDPSEQRVARDRLDAYIIRVLAARGVANPRGLVDTYLARVERTVLASPLLASWIHVLDARAILNSLAAVRSDTAASLGHLAQAVREGDQITHHSLAEILGRVKKLGDPESPPSYEQAYLTSPYGDMLRREELSDEDLAEGRAIPPPHAEELAQMLLDRRSIAVQGAPGSGKSGLAAYVSWLCQQQETRVRRFAGRDLQAASSAEVERICGDMAGLPADCILLIDDAHLVREILARLIHLPWSAERVFFLLARPPYFDRARAIPNVQVFEISQDDSACVATRLAHQYQPDAADRLLARSNSDLVYTKWLLEAYARMGAEAEPTEAAAAMLGTIADTGLELARLFLTLAAFGSLDLWCPWRFLAADLGFGWQSMQYLTAVLHEVGLRKGVQGSHPEPSFMLQRHPKLCRLFLDAAPHCLWFDAGTSGVLGDTCAALRVEKARVSSGGFRPLVLGAATWLKVTDLDALEWRMIYDDAKLDYRNTVMAAVDLELARSGKSRGNHLSQEQRDYRTKLAYAAANGERRLLRGTLGKELLSTLQRKLGLTAVLTQPSENTGYVLYQDAYLMRLCIEGHAALDRFEESARADEAWANRLELPLYRAKVPLHRAKATMSRIAAAAYRIDLALFAGREPEELTPDRAGLEAVAGVLHSYIDTLDELLSLPEIDARERVEAFRANALHHSAEALGWLGDREAASARIGALDAMLRRGNPYIEREAARRSTLLAMGALAVATGRYSEAVTILDGQPQEMVEYAAGETAGKLAVMLLLCYLKLDNRAKAEAVRSWLLSDGCPTDAGNGLAKEWARRLPATGGGA